MNGKVVVPLLTLFAVTVFSGCGGSDTSGREATYKISGKVTFGGSPLAGATIRFFPEAGQRSAMGFTNNDGEYVLTTYEYGDGAMAGAYGVSIQKPAPRKESVNESSHEAFASGNVDLEAMHAAKADEGSDSEIPTRYANPEESGFAVVVKADGENRFDLALEP